MLNQKRVIRKYNRKNPMENNKHLSALAKKASRSAISTRFAAGIPVVYKKLITSSLNIRAMPSSLLL